VSEPCPKCAKIELGECTESWTAEDIPHLAELHADLVVKDEAIREFGRLIEWIDKFVPDLMVNLSVNDLVSFEARLALARARGDETFDSPPDYGLKTAFFKGRVLQ
jgi:hypothetical protein